MQNNPSTENSGQSKTLRLADRFDTELPIELDGIPGLTKNISATGIYFESQINQAPGSVVQFVVDVEAKKTCCRCRTAMCPPLTPIPMH
ncbi:MAG: hypothetical protein JZU64_08205 [Rhodoferax sp.]|jgi:hypothetical protein|nr:hypothetical protein [Rhodoferax sp.]